MLNNVLEQESYSVVVPSTTQVQGEGIFDTNVILINAGYNADDVITLPPAIPGTRILIINRESTNSGQIFPNVGDDIDGNGVDTAIALDPDLITEFLAIDETNWVALY